MNKFIEELDKAVLSFIYKLVGFSAFMLTTITLIQVLARYIFKVSIGGLGELPVYFMMICIWLTAATAVRTNDHVSVEFVSVFIKNKTFNKIVKFIVDIIALACVIIFVKLGFEYVIVTFKGGNTSPGLRFPIWWLATVVFISGLLMSIYYVAIVGNNIKEVKK